MNPIIVDEEKCVGCSLCVYDCPNACLHLIGYPAVKYQRIVPRKDLKAKTL